MVDVARLERVIGLLEQTIKRKRKYAQDLRDDTFTSMLRLVTSMSTLASLT